MFKLEEYQTAIIKDCKEYFQTNDLEGFYTQVADSVHHNDGYYSIQTNNNEYYECGDLVDCGPEEIGGISHFLDDSGIYVEDFMDYIPDFYCYLPQRWLGKNQFFWLPEKIYAVNWMGFTETQAKGIVFTNVLKLESFILEDARVDVAVFTDKLRLAADDALKYTNLTKVLIPRQYMDDLKNAPPGIQSVVSQCKDDDIKVMGYTNL